MSPNFTRSKLNGFLWNDDAGLWYGIGAFAFGGWWPFIVLDSTFQPSHQRVISHCSFGADVRQGPLKFAYEYSTLIVAFIMVIFMSGWTSLRINKNTGVCGIEFILFYLIFVWMYIFYHFTPHYGLYFGFFIVVVSFSKIIDLFFSFDYLVVISFVYHSILIFVPYMLVIFRFSKWAFFQVLRISFKFHCTTNFEETEQWELSGINQHKFFLFNVP